MELFAADGHDAGGCERVTGKSGMRPTDQKLMWFLWGERTLRHGALMALREELLRDVYGNYGHIHARWRVFDGEVESGMLKAEDVEYDGLDG